LEVFFVKKVLVPLADGAEEMEAVIIIDTFRRAGWEVAVAGLKEGFVTASRGVKILPDINWDNADVNNFDIVAMPGGMVGVDKLRNHNGVIEAVREFYEKGKIVAAICAAPLVLQSAGILKGKKFTSHPAVINQLTEGERLEETVVIDGNIITSQGPGTTFQFALAVIAMVEGEEKSDSLAGAMIVERRKACTI
jgi:protein deglycase